MFYKTGVLKYRKISRKRLCRSLFLENLQAYSQYPYKQETPAQVFYWEFCKIFLTMYFIEHLWETAFVYLENVLICETKADTL